MDPIVDQEPATEPRDEALALHRPAVPVNLDQLAALDEKAHAIIDARVRILDTARKAAIRFTHPEDWVLFKSPEGQVVGYLQDSGCERVRDIFGISVTPTSAPEKITAAHPGEFHYVVRGDGHSTLTAQTIEGIEGGRSSTEDFCKDKTGAALELAVRKAARANLDGAVVRELAGLSSVPIAELEAAWTGTHKTPERCRLGRGFGSRSERLGATATRGGAPDVEPPVCPFCQTKGVYRPAKDGRAAFYGCPNYTKHPNKKFIVDAEKWAQEAARIAAAAPATHAPEPSKVEAQQSAPLTADEVFGGREPGSEG